MKLKANKESYGFMGKHWFKGQEVEVAEDTKYPEKHFDVVGGKVKPTSKKEEGEKKPKAEAVEAKDAHKK